MFVELVKAVHADEAVIDDQESVDISLVRGLVYDSSVVRGCPTYKFKVKVLRQEQYKHKKETNNKKI